jgi:hypothetical protein
MLAISLFGHKSVLTQIEMSYSQILKPLQNQQKSVLTQIDITRSRNLKPFHNKQKSVLMQNSPNLTSPIMSRSIQYCLVKTLLSIIDNDIARVSAYFISLTEQYCRSLVVKNLQSSKPKNADYLTPEA